LEQIRIAHGTLTVAECPDHECMICAMICAMILCPHSDEDHLHHDGCPSCIRAENDQTEQKEAEDEIG
jgi:hypothetical protein